MSVNALNLGQAQQIAGTQQVQNEQIYKANLAQVDYSPSPVLSELMMATILQKLDPSSPAAAFISSNNTKLLNTSAKMINNNPLLKDRFGTSLNGLTSLASFIKTQTDDSIIKDMLEQDAEYQAFKKSAKEKKMEFKVLQKEEGKGNR